MAIDNDYMYMTIDAGIVLIVIVLLLIIVGVGLSTKFVFDYKIEDDKNPKISDQQLQFLKVSLGLFWVSLFILIAYYCMKIYGDKKENGDLFLEDMSRTKNTAVRKPGNGYLNQERVSRMV
jgi:uncharacterized protein YneF (UPF0154 family)